MEYEDCQRTLPGRGAGIEEDAARISRRGLLKRLGLGAAIVTFSPVMTSLADEALAAEDCHAPCEWSCGGLISTCATGCGPFGTGYCSQTVRGNCFCWEDSFCSDIRDCTTNGDCPPGFACIPGTCCGTASTVASKCLPPCGPGRRSRLGHGAMASGRVV